MRYQVEPCDGHVLEKLLNDMDEGGFEKTDIFLIGSKQVENKLMPNQQTIVPLFMVVFERRARIDA